MSGQVDVAIAKTDSRRDPPGLDIFYQVTNSGPDPIWLVNDGWIIWSQSGGRIEISLARGKMNPASAVFGYFVPATVEIPSGSTRAGSLALDWPLKLDRLWNREESVRLPPGHYDFVLRVGYGITPFPDDPVLGEGVESPVLRWQKEAVAAAVSVEVK
jgi:hypothetical protein